jgi:hypothetical protein
MHDTYSISYWTCNFLCPYVFWALIVFIGSVKEIDIFFKNNRVLAITGCGHISIRHPIIGISWQALHTCSYVRGQRDRPSPEQKNTVRHTYVSALEGSCCPPDRREGTVCPHRFTCHHHSRQIGFVSLLISYSLFLRPTQPCAVAKVYNPLRGIQGDVV